MLKVTAMAHGLLQAKRNDLADIVVKLLHSYSYKTFILSINNAVLLL